MTSKRRQAAATLTSDDRAALPEERLESLVQRGFGLGDRELSVPTQEVDRVELGEHVARSRDRLASRAAQRMG